MPAAPSQTILPRRLSAVGQQEADHEFLKAVNKGSVGEMRSALAAGANLLAKDHHGNSALHIAARTNAPSMLLVELMHRGIPLDIRNADDETPLHMSAMYNRSIACRTLLQLGANPHLQDRGGRNALHLAARMTASQIFKDLFKAGIRTDVSTKARQTAEEIAAELANTDFVYQDFKQWQQNQHMVASILKQPDAMESWFVGNGPFVQPDIKRGTWEYFPTVLAQRRASGQVVRFSDLGPYSDSLASRATQTVLGAAARDYQLPHILNALRHEGIILGTKELLDGQGKPSQCLTEIAANHGLRHILCYDYWKGRSARELRQVLSALPDEWKLQIAAPNQLALQLQRDEQQLSPQRGRG